MQMVKEAEESGAKVLIGDKSRNGAVVQPHVLVDVKPGMRAWDRESFGPRKYCSHSVASLILISCLP